MLPRFVDVGLLLYLLAQVAGLLDRILLLGIQLLVNLFPSLLVSIPKLRLLS